MFREMHYMDRSMREMDLAEKMAERRRQSLATTGKSSRRARMAWRLFAFAATAGSRQAEGRA
jgi:hypothetical protein